MDKPYLNDKFWDTRRRFTSVKDESTTISSYIQMLKKIGFIVSSKSANYTAGKRINTFDENGKPAWISGTVQTFYPLIGQCNRKIIADFKKHLFTTKRNCGLKKYPIELIPDGDISKSKAISKNLRGCVNTFGLTMKCNTNVIVWDIDVRIAKRGNFKSTLEVLDLLLKHLNMSVKDLLLVEYNKYEEGGLHVYFKVSDGEKLNKSRFGLFVKESTGFDIEYNFTKNVLRLPMSYEYQPIRLTKFGKILNLVNKGLKITDDCFYKTLDDAIASIDENKIALDGTKCPYLTSDLVKSSDENTIKFAHACYKKFKHLLEENTARIHDKILKEEENKRGYKYSKRFNETDFIKDHRFETGGSWKALEYTVPYLKERGYSAEEVYSILEKMDNGSRFFGKEKRSAKSKIEKWYNISCTGSKALEYSTKRFYYVDMPVVAENAIGWKVGYIENNQNVSQKDKELLFKPYTGLYIYKHFIEAAKMLLDDEDSSMSLKKTCKAVLNVKYKEQLIHQLPSMVLELVGKYIYDRKYKNNRGQAEGLQVPEILMNRIIQFVNTALPEKGTHAFNGKQFRIILLRMFGLCPVTNKEKGRPYSTHHCTVWNDVDSDTVFENFLTDLNVFYAFYLQTDIPDNAFKKALSDALFRMIMLISKRERTKYGGRFLIPKFIPPVAKHNENLCLT